MLKIFKYKIPTTCWIRMPAGAKILSFQNQHGSAVIWALIDEEKPLVQYDFALLATGEIVNEEVAKSQYIGTAQFDQGHYIVHLFLLGAASE